MSTPLLATKLFIPPPPPMRVARPRLVKRLEEGVTRRLTLLSAPPGFGKTTLLGEWIHTLAPVPAHSGRGKGAGKKVAWLALDAGDNDPVRFLAYLVAALERIQPEIGHATQALVQSPQPPPIESILITLVNEMAGIRDGTAMVLDDLHVIETRAVYSAIDFLLEHLPLPVHLVISSRSDPPLLLARLRAQGQLIEIRAADLRFTPEEAAAFLNQVMDLKLSAQDINALEARTEGWIAGLQMAALSMRGRQDIEAFIASFSGSHSFVMDYMTEQVLQRQTAKVQQFLL